MAKVHLKLDTRKNRQKKDGTFPLVISLHHNSKSRPIGLKYAFKIEDWDTEKLVPLNIKNAKHIGAKLESYLMKARVFINEYILDLEFWTIQELKSRLEAEIFSTSKTTERTKLKYTAMKTENVSLTEFAENQIQRLRLAKRNGSAESLKDSIARFRAFSGFDAISFAQVDVLFLENFTAYCYSRDNKASTIHTYLKPIRKLFNDAISLKLISPEIFPFDTYKIPKAAKTKNRALRLEEIEAIRSLKLKRNSAVWNAKNYFLFMFNNMGINFIDLAKLKKKQLINVKYDETGKLVEGRITFNRSKTADSFSIKLTDESIQILNYYGVGEKSNEEFVFQYGYEETELGRKRYKQHRKRLNKKLKEIAELAGLDEPLTTYYARHSWATIAKRKMIPVTMISEALGHKNLKTTQIYLDSFDNDELDAANENVVG